TPDFAKEIITRHDATLTLGEVLQDVVFAPSQVDRLAALHGLLMSKIDDDAAERQPLDLDMRPAQDGVHAQQQFLEIERLGDVVVGAEIETAKLVDLLSARG